VIKRSEALQKNSQTPGLGGLSWLLAGYTTLGVGMLLIPWSRILYLFVGVVLIPVRLILSIWGAYSFRVGYRRRFGSSQEGLSFMLGALSVSFATWMSSLTPHANYPVRDAFLLADLILALLSFFLLGVDYRRKAGSLSRWFHISVSSWLLRE